MTQVNFCYPGIDIAAKCDRHIHLLTDSTIHLISTYAMLRAAFS